MKTSPVLGWRYGLIGQATIETLKHDLIGEDPIDVERLWHKMWVPKIIGRRGLTTRAISAIDIGLWDIRAKWARLPLYKLLGGFRDRMADVHRRWLLRRRQRPERAPEEMEENIKLGARAVKMKVGGVPMREDVARVKAVRRSDRSRRQAAGGRQLRLSLVRGDPVRPSVSKTSTFSGSRNRRTDDYEGSRKLAEKTSSRLPR